MNAAAAEPASAGSRRATLWRALLLALVPTLVLLPSFLPGRVFLPQAPRSLEPLASEAPERAARASARMNYLASDRLFPILTDQRALAARVRSAQLPAWEPGLGIGMPLAAATMFGPFHPLHLLSFAFDPVTAGVLLAFLALWLAGLGQWLFLERLGVTPAACAVGAFSLQAGGFALANLHYVMKVEAALALPWCLWAIEGMARGRRGAGAGLAIAAGASLLAGFVPIAVFVLIAAGTYAIVRAKPHALLWLVAGVALAAIQLLPTARASAESLRAPANAEVVASGRLPLASAWTLVAPDALGRPDDPWFAPQNALVWRWTRTGEAELAQNANLLEWNLFVGVCVLALALGGCAQSPRRAVFPAMLVALSLGFAAGLPPLDALYGLPGLNLGAPARAAAIAWVGWSWLAALGCEGLFARRRAVVLASTSLAATAGALGVWMRNAFANTSFTSELRPALAQRYDMPLEQVRALLSDAHCAAALERWHAAGMGLVVASAVALSALLAAAHCARSTRWSRAAVAPILAALLLQAGVFATPHLAPRALDGDELFPPSTALDAVADAADGGRVVRFDASASGLDDVLSLARPNLLQAYGVADLTAYTVFTPRRLVELMAAVDPGSTYRTGISRVSQEELLGHPVLDRLGVSAVLSRKALDQSFLEPVYAHDGFHVYRRSGALPFARVVPESIATASSDACLGLLAGRMSDPERQVVLSPGVAPPQAPAEAEQTQASARWERPRPEHIVVDVHAPAGGWLVVSEAWHPGWRASIDGAQAAVEAVDHALCGVLLPPGDSRVELHFGPRSFTLGATLSLATLLVTLYFGCARRRAS